MEFATDEHLNLSSQPVPRTESDSPSLSVGTIVNTSKVADPSASATTSSSLAPQQSEGFRMMKPRLPPELQMITIDWMVVATNENGFRKLKDQTTLLNCMCVCYAWKSYIQKFLHNDVYIKIEESCNNLLKWREFLKHNPSKVKSIRSIALSCDGLDLTYAALLITQKLQSLETLYILQWNLGEEPFWIYRAAACMTSLNCLHLDSLKQCTVAQLVKIINSFHHLSKLSVNFAHPNQKLEVKNQPLSRPCRLPTFSLESLRIEHIEGVSILLDWFVEANPFVANLKELALRLWARDIDEEDEDEEESNCEGFSRFLDHCGGSLEQLTLWIDLSEKDDTINFISLASLKRLKRLTYQHPGKERIPEWAIMQLAQLPAENLQEICFDHPQELDEYGWAQIDQILNGDKFKSLQVVEVWPETIIDYLPKLNEKGVLRPYQNHTW